MKIHCILLVTIFSIICGWNCRKKHDKEVHYIKKGYTGIVYIIHNQNDGSPVEYDDTGSRIYRIPSTGVLKSKFKPNPGGFKQSDIRFYYIDDTGIIRKFPWYSLFTTYHQILLNEKNTVSDDSIAILGYNYVTSKVIRDSLNIETGSYGYTTYIIDTVRNIRFQTYPSLSNEMIESN